MTHCAIVPFITVAHKHIKRNLTLVLFQDVFFHVFVLHTFPLALAQCPTSLQLTPPHTHTFIVGLKWHQLLSPFSSREWCSVSSTSFLQRDKRLNLNTVSFSLYGSFCLSFRNVVFLYFSFLLREWELTRHKPKNILLNCSLNGVFFISGSTDKASQKALQLKPWIHVTKQVKCTEKHLCSDVSLFTSSHSHSHVFLQNMKLKNTFKCC